MGKLTLDFSVAKLQHQQWKLRLRALLDGEIAMSESEAVSHRDCELGHWIYDIGMKQFSSVSAMNELEKVHADMHRSVRKVIEQKNLGNEDSAEHEYDALTTSSEKILRLLDDIDREVG